MRQFVKKLLEALFKVLFTYECVGEEKVPLVGPAVVAANHPSYLDPILLSLHVERPIRFMAWDAMFKVPFVGSLMRSFGAFPVDVRKGKGREAYEKAKAFVEAGEIVGIFPEGRRSQTGWLESSLREGVARLAWETGAPLIPATIVGAYRAWPHFQSLPRPARIKVRFHDPINPLAYSNLPEDDALPALLAELRQRVERTLLPGRKKDLRIGLLYRFASPWPRLYEYLPALGAALLVFWKTRSWLAVLPAYAYVAYLFADHLLIPQRRLVKWLRNASPVLFLIGYGPVVLRVLGLPPPPASRALAAIILGALFPYIYEHGRTTLGFIRGLVAAACLELGALLIAPAPAGPHVALALFAAAYAWERTTVFSRYAAPTLAVYALGFWRLVGGGLELVPHAVAGLLACLLVQLFPLQVTPRQAEEPQPAGLGLGL